jgi:hypothetical protein
MLTAQPFPQQPRFSLGIGISLAVHLVLIGLWQLARPVALQDDGPAPRVQFLRLLPAPAPAPDRPDAVPPPPARPFASATRAPAAARPPRVQTEAAESVPETITLPAAPGADTAATPPVSGTDLLRDAKAAVGAVDRALRAENPGRGIRAPVESRQTRLEKGIVRAGELAPNKWYQAPKMEEIIDPGGYGRRRYRVVGALGTYCVTYESNHAPDGIDSMKEGIKPKRTNCEETEEPAKAQKWN